MLSEYVKILPLNVQCVKDTAKTFVLDCEAVAFDVKEGKLMPFQELSRRKRKDVKVEDITVRVHLFAFDILYLNGEVSCLPLAKTSDTECIQPLLQKTLSERREILQQHFQPVFGEFNFAKASDGDTTEAIQAFLEESVKDGCEGLMIKMLENEASFYEPSKRSVNWLKVRNASSLQLPTDSLPTAQERLLGRRWRLSRSCSSGRILWQGQTNKRLWCIPSRLL